MSGSNANQRRRNKVRRRARSHCKRVGWELFLVAQEHKCSICGNLLVINRSKECYGISVDHVRPLNLEKVEGIRYNTGNILLSHKNCNSRKGDSMPTLRELEMLERVNRLLQLTHDGQYRASYSTIINLTLDINKLNHILRTLTVLPFTEQAILLSYRNDLEKQLSPFNELVELMNNQNDNAPASNRKRIKS